MAKTTYRTIAKYTKAKESHSYEAIVWFHSSVGRVSHRYRGGRGFECHPAWLLFSGFFNFQSLKLENSPRWSWFPTWILECPTISFFLISRTYKRKRITNFFLVLISENFRGISQLMWSFTMSQKSCLRVFFKSQFWRCVLKLKGTELIIQ